MKSSMLFLPLTLVAFVGVACGDDDGDTTGSGGSATTGSSMGGNTTTSSSSGMGGDASTSSSTTTGGMGGGGGCAPEAGCFNYCDFTPTSVDFATEVVPIIEGSCNNVGGNSCHGGSAGGLSLSGGAAGIHAAIVNVTAGDAPNQNLVTPGDPADSYLMIKIDGDMGCSNSGCSNMCGERMPRAGGNLDAIEANIIRSWIANGASM